MLDGVYVCVCVRSVHMSSHGEAQGVGGEGSGEEEVIWVLWSSPGGPFLCSSSGELSCDHSVATSPGRAWPAGWDRAGAAHTNLV